MRKILGKCKLFAVFLFLLWDFLFVYLRQELMALLMRLQESTVKCQKNNSTLCHDDGAALCLLPLPELSGVHVFHPIEEAGEGGDFCEMELVGDLGDAHRGLAQEERGFHQQHLVDVIDDGAAARNLTDNS